MLKHIPLLALFLFSACGQQSQSQVEKINQLDCKGAPSAVVNGTEYCCGTIADAIAMSCKDIWLVTLSDGTSCFYHCGGTQW